MSRDTSFANPLKVGDRLAPVKAISERKVLHELLFQAPTFSPVNPVIVRQMIRRFDATRINAKERMKKVFHHAKNGHAITRYAMIGLPLLFDQFQ